MTVALAFLILALLAILGAAWGGIRYKHGLNPLTVFLIVEIGFFSLFPGVIAYYSHGGQEQLLASDWRDEDIIRTILITVVYTIGNMLVYTAYPRWSAELFHQGMRLFHLQSEQIGHVFNPLKLTLLALCAIGAFVCLAVVGGGGFLWITNTREAYLTHRAGAGPFFAVTQWLVNIGFIYALWGKRPRFVGTGVYCLLFSLPLYLTGSKNAILTIFMIAAAYIHFRVQRIPAKAVFLMGLPAAAVATIGLQSLYGGETSFVEGLYYFNYFSTTAEFIGRFDEFGFAYGEAAVTQLWTFVPRAIYPDKPYEYGVGLVHKVLFPGAAEMGHTPGILPWTMWYLDFGVYGVFGIGLLQGWLRRAAFEYYLRRPRCMFAFVAMIQISIWPIFHYAPTFIVLLFCSSQAILLGEPAASPRARLVRIASTTPLRSRASTCSSVTRSRPA